MIATYYTVFVLFAVASRADSAPALMVSIVCIDKHCCQMRIYEQFTSVSTVFLPATQLSDGGLAEVCTGCVVKKNVTGGKSFFISRL